MRGTIRGSLEVITFRVSSSQLRRTRSCGMMAAALGALSSGSKANRLFRPLFSSFIARSGVGKASAMVARVTSPWKCMMSPRGKNLRPLGAFGLFGEEVYVFVTWFGLDWLEVVLSTWPPRGGGGGLNFFATVLYLAITV